MRKILLAIVTAVIVLIPNAQAAELDRLHSLNQPRYHELQSEILDRSLHLFVRLPDDYAQSAARYPTVYLLDGGITFPLLSSYYKYLSLGDEVPEAVIVGVAYSADNFANGNYRGTDFTAPAPDRDYFGGAENFQRVFETELLPLIEENYRANPDKRIIFGQSLGGQFALYTALTKPSLFWGHIASNPALHRNLPFFLDFDFLQDDATASRVFVSSGEHDDDVFRGPALEWFNYWNDETVIKPWVLETRTLPDETHFSAAPSAFRNGMKWLFSDTETPDNELN